MKKLFYVVCLLGGLFLTDNATAQIRQIWLNYCRHEPTHIVVNWISEQPGNSKIYWGSTPEYGYSSEILEETTLHRIEIPLNLQSERVYYKLVSGDQESATLSFKNYAGLGDSLRIAVIANIGYMKGHLDSLEREVPDLLMTCGDNVPDLHKLCGAGELNCIAPYLELIGRYPALFASTSFMPILGNHDKEIRPRGAEPPAIAVYDTNATAFRKFVELPDKEWVWSFQLPDFDVSFLALDLNHTYDVGTTWQSCHDFTLNSSQYQWYKEQVERNDASILITLMNEKNETVRNMENGIWNPLLKSNTAVITGCCYMAEWAQTDGVHYFNTSAIAGDVFPDPYSKSLYREDGYLMLVFHKNAPLRVDMKKLNGELLKSVWVEKP